MTFAPELRSWIALHAAGVRGSLRAEVCACGVEQALASGSVGGRRFDSTIARARAAQAEAFLDAGGKVLGAAQGSELGLLAGRPMEPLCVFARGNTALLNTRPAIAIVGSRAATSRGLMWARAFARQVVEAGAVVVSGGARGIDQAAHAGALQAGGTTIAVLGEPIRADGSDERAPELRRLFDGHRERALSLSSYGPWVTAAPYLFAARNQFIAGLADAVVVVEGQAESGTRHTAAAARALGIPVWCPPGDLETSAICNAWLREGSARWVEHRALGAQLFGSAHAPAPGELDLGESVAPRDEHPLAQAVRDAGGRLLVDEAARRLGWPLPELLAALAELELEGALRREGACLVRP